jgi:glycosyltransferase involved in cell wall biosynthesis
MSYVIVTPVRNEAQFLPLTIRSVVSQSVQPLRWVIVDDGSTDETAAIAERAALQYAWIQVIRRADRGRRVAGSGVMEAFYDGYRLLDEEPWDFIVKLDGDLSFKRDYFEQCLSVFHAQPHLGMGGGLICIEKNGAIEQEYPDPLFHVRGPTKIYRRECWRQIGGLIRSPGWDTFDQIKANMLGWTTRTFEDIRLVHHRPTGGAYGSWSNWTKNGLANYVVGYHPVFMLLKCIGRCFRKPYGITGLGLMAGFLSGYAKRIPQVNEPQVIRYLRAQQKRCLLLQRSLWNQNLA